MRTEVMAAVAVAMVNNPRLQATLAELGIARADLWQASVIRNPLFEAEIRFPRDPFRPFELRLRDVLHGQAQLRRGRHGRVAEDALKGLLDGHGAFDPSPAGPARLRARC